MQTLFGIDGKLEYLANQTFKVEVGEMGDDELFNDEPDFDNDIELENMTERDYGYDC